MKCFDKYGEQKGLSENYQPAIPSEILFFFLFSAYKYEHKQARKKKMHLKFLCLH